MNTQYSTTPYSYIWHKYRPVILRMMVNAADATQHYEFSGHEFRRIFPKNRSSLAFILYIHRLKAINNIKAAPLAQALLGVLQQSKTVENLTEGSTYEFMLDNKFVFHVRKNEAVNELSKIENEVLALENAEAAMVSENSADR